MYKLLLSLFLTTITSNVLAAELKCGSGYQGYAWAAVRDARDVLNSKITANSAIENLTLLQSLDSDGWLTVSLCATLTTFKSGKSAPQVSCTSSYQGYTSTAFQFARDDFNEINAGKKVTNIVTEQSTYSDNWVTVTICGTNP